MAEEAKGSRVSLWHRERALQVVSFGALAAFGLLLCLPDAVRVGGYVGALAGGMFGLWARGRVRRQPGLEELRANARVESAGRTAVRVVASSSLLIAGDVAGIYYPYLAEIAGGLALAALIFVVRGLKQTLSIEVERGLTVFQPTPGWRYWRSPSVYFYSTDPLPERRAQTVGPAAGLLLVMVVAFSAGTYVNHVHGQSDRRAAAKHIRLSHERALGAEPSPGKDVLEAANLDAAAFAVSDKYVYAEYVSHSCADSNMVVDGLLCDAGDALHNEDYLVRDSARLVFADCRATVNLCVEYTVITRKPPPCTVYASTVYLRRVAGRWKVVEGDTSDTSSGPCPRLWQRRIRYEKS